MSTNYSTETEKIKTRGSLVPAELYACDAKGENLGKVIRCTFNPFEYTVSQSNSYDYKPKAKAGTKVELKNAGPQTLKLSLLFDVYEEKSKEKRDVSLITRELWTLMTPDPEDKTPKQEKPDAPFVTFKWGVFKFLAVITNMTQKFTLFDFNGIPLRAKVDITLTQHASQAKDYEGKAGNVSSLSFGGDPPPKKLDAPPDERLDNIAAEVLGDPAKWRAIAEHNNITNPLATLPKRPLIKPPGW